ncbi:MAG: hypothetical protein HWE14_03375 [Flavobacteriia bacterium]|nr:hypothetical protein [Flavobacteriia bacterium]
MDNLEIKLRKDTAGNDVELGNMDLIAAKAVNKILSSLIKIVEHESDLDLKIGVEKGSAVQRITSEKEGDIRVVYSKIEAARAAAANRDNAIIKQLNVIQSNIAHFSDYTISYQDKSLNEPLNINHYFARKFKQKRDRNKEYLELEMLFSKGKLIDVGGKNPNLHVQTASELTTISCTKTQAKQLVHSLYEEVYLGCWKLGSTDPVLCIAFSSSEIYDSFYQISEKLSTASGTQPFHLISNKIEELLDKNDLERTRAFIKLFSHANTPIEHQRPILTMMKAFKNDSNFKDVLKEIEKGVRKKIGKVY